MRRWLITNGKIGKAPPEYYLFRAADRCNCTPWQLEEQPTYYRDWALTIAAAEIEAENERNKPQK